MNLLDELKRDRFRLELLEVFDESLLDGERMLGEFIRDRDSWTFDDFDDFDEVIPSHISDEYNLIDTEDVRYMLREFSRMMNRYDDERTIEENDVSMELVGDGDQIMLSVYDGFDDVASIVSVRTYRRLLDMLDAPYTDDPNLNIFSVVKRYEIVGLPTEFDPIYDDILTILRDVFGVYHQLYASPFEILPGNTWNSRYPHSIDEIFRNIRSADEVIQEGSNIVQRLHSSDISELAQWLLDDSPDTWYQTLVGIMDLNDFLEINQEDFSMFNVDRIMQVDDKVLIFVRKHGGPPIDIRQTNSLDDVEMALSMM